MFDPAPSARRRRIRRVLGRGGVPRRRRRGVLPDPGQVEEGRVDDPGPVEEGLHEVAQFQLGLAPADGEPALEVTTAAEDVAEDA